MSGLIKKEERKRRTVKINNSIDELDGDKEEDEKAQKQRKISQRKITQTRRIK